MRTPSLSAGIVMAGLAACSPKPAETSLNHRTQAENPNNSAACNCCQVNSHDIEVLSDTGKAMDAAKVMTDALKNVGIDTTTVPACNRDNLLPVTVQKDAPKGRVSEQWPKNPNPWP